MKKFALVGFAALLLVWPNKLATCFAQSQVDPTAIDQFESSIRPLLGKHCVECHGASRAESGLRLDSRHAMLVGGESGPAINLNTPNSSLILRALRHEEGLEMPPKGPLEETSIDAVYNWIREGAAWPNGMVVTPVGPNLRSGAITDQDREFWSFQPVRNPSPPNVPEKFLVQNEIDQFVAERLSQEGIEPVEPASRRDLLRRAALDLTGLPPTIELMDEFVSDSKPVSFESVVDRLLASPAYGERWGRHWLDVVRYADTAGETADYPTPLAYKYRNWVIDAINEDMPFRDFCRQQIAGDLIARQAYAEADSTVVDEDQLLGYQSGHIATGFIAISRRFGFDVENYHHLTIQDTIDVVGQSMLGLTLGCARCHDHKYDPVNMDDYYAWYGIFESTRYAFPGSEEKKRPYDLVPLLPERVLQERIVEQQKQIASVQASISAHEAAYFKVLNELNSAKGYLSEVRTRLLRQFTDSPDGHSGFVQWSANPLPLVGVNQSETTLQVPGTVPPASLVVHPNPQEGVGIGWLSPMEGTVQISGRIKDAHDCGDGVAWFVDHLSNEGWDNRLAGEIGANGEQAIGLDGERQFQVAVGDWVQLVVMPKSNHGCDLTEVEFQLIEVDGAKRVWDLRRDVLTDFSEGNPNDDSLGNAEVWYFFTAAVDRGHANSSLRPTALDAGAIEGLEQELAREERELALLRGQLSALQAEAPYESAYAVLDQSEVRDAVIQLRGEKERPGETVVRRNLAILGGQPLNNPQQSGRLELADWIVSSPLFARVIVNRVWQQHFGTGLVSTANDFGARGARPTHPELLEWLTARFVESNYSLKHLHRLIMSSAAYQRASTWSLAGIERDPESQYLWRFNRRRLSAEEIRDAMLQVSGQLDRAVGTEHPFPPVESWGFTQHTPFYGVYATNQRSVYLMQQRLKRHPFLGLFDSADTNVSIARRDVTTVPTQALLLMNSDWVHEQASVLTNEVLEISQQDSERLTAVYRRTLLRAPNAREVADGLDFLQAYRALTASSGIAAGDSSAWQAVARTLLTRNEFLFVD